MKMRIGITCLLFILLMSRTAFAAPMISIEPDLTKVAVGAIFSIEVVISGEDIEDMSAWNGTLQFDPDVLAFRDADIGAFRCSDAAFQFNDPSGRDMALKATSQNGVSLAEFSAFYGTLDCLLW